VLEVADISAANYTAVVFVGGFPVKIAVRLVFSVALILLCHFWFKW